MQNLKTEPTNNSWSKNKVSDLTYHPQYGWTTSASKNSGLKLLRTTDISGGQINWDTVPNCLINPPQEDKYLLANGDILVSRAGSIGLSCYIENPPKAVFASYLIRFRAKEEIIRSKLLYYFFQSPQYWTSIGAGEAGIAIPNVNATKISDIEVGYPTSFEEQEAIIKKLDNLLPEVKINAKRIAKVKLLINKFKQALFYAAITGKLTEEWRELNPSIEPAPELLQRIVYPPKKKVSQKRDINTDQLPEIPSTWSWVLFEQIGELARGKSKHRPRNDPKLFGGRYPFIQTGDVARSNGKISSYNQTYNDEGLSQSRLFPTGTLCITIAANIADSGILQIDACFPDSVVGFIPYLPLPSADYFYYFINTAKDNLEQFAPATAQKNINLGILNELAIPLPPLEEQKEIVKRVTQYLEVASQIEKQVGKAEVHVSKLTQAVLAKTFRQ